MDKLLTIPLLPLSTLDELPVRLEAFHSKLITAKSSPPRSAAVEAQALLPYCAVNPPLPERPTHILSDINTSFSDLLDKVSTAQGRAILQDYAGDASAADRVIRFWTKEDSCTASGEVGQKYHHIAVAHRSRERS